VLAADAQRLTSEVLEVVDAGAEAIHVDVMDGEFVPTLGFCADTVSSLRSALAGRDVLLDVHLMVARPSRWVSEFARAGADLITVHAETGLEVRHAIDAIHGAGCFAGLAVSPSTPPSVFSTYTHEIDVALCMTVQPGRGGQPFIETSPGRIAELREHVLPATAIEVDGGIDGRTAPMCVQQGARLLVAGSSIFGARDPGAAFTELTTLARQRASLHLEAA
jgi:ribulose-phosphate 3-epimerase